MADENPRICGNCKFGAPDGQERVTCFGAPPVPVLMGMTQDRWGRPAPQLMNVRPSMPNSEPACRVFERRETIILGGRAN